MTGKNQSRSFIRGRALAISAVAALAGGALAAALTSAQGPGDYQPSTTTVTVTTSPTTTTLPSGGGEELTIRLSLKGTAGKQKIDKDITVELRAEAEERATRQADSIFVSGHGKIAVRVEPGGRGKQCRKKPKGKDKKYKLGNDFDTISNGGTTTLTLSVPKKAQKEIANRITCKDTKAKAKVRIEASASGAADRKKDRTVKVRPN